MRIFWTGLAAFAAIVSWGVAGQPVQVPMGPMNVGPSCHNQPSTVMVPQTVRVPKTRTVKKTVQVPQTVMIDKTIDVQETYYEDQTIEVPHVLVPQQQYVPQQVPVCPTPQCVPYGQGAYYQQAPSSYAASNHVGNGGDYTIDTDGDGDPDYLVHEGDEEDDEPRCLLGRLAQRKRENGGGLFHRIRDRRDNGDSIIPLPEPAPGVPIPLP